VAVPACTLSCHCGSVDCHLDLLCTKAVVILPDFTVESVILALNLLVEAAGKEVMQDYECLLPAGPVLTVLGISFTIGSNDIQVLASRVNWIQVFSAPSRQLWRWRWWLRSTMCGHYRTAF
jgi:hypothetical protein